LIGSYLKNLLGIKIAQFHSKHMGVS